MNETETEMEDQLTEMNDQLYYHRPTLNLSAAKQATLVKIDSIIELVERHNFTIALDEFIQQCGFCREFRDWSRYLGCGQCPVFKSLGYTVCFHHDFHLRLRNILEAASGGPYYRHENIHKLEERAIKMLKILHVFTRRLKNDSKPKRLHFNHLESPHPMPGIRSGGPGSLSAVRYIHRKQQY